MRYIKFNLPKELKTNDGLLNIMIDYNGSTESISRSIPIILNKVEFTMFPEGGDLVCGLDNNVAFTALNEFGKPADVEGVVQRTIGVEAGESVARCAVDGREIAADQHLAVGLESHGPNRGVRAGAGIEGVIERAIREQAGHAVAAGAIPGGEGAGEQDFAVQLDGHVVNNIIRAHRGAEGVIEKTVLIQPGDPAARRSVHLGKRAPEDHFSIRLEGERLDWIVRAISAGHEIGVEGAVRLQAGDAIARRPVDGKEGTPDQDFAVGLHGERLHGIIRAKNGGGSGGKVQQTRPFQRLDLPSGADHPS